jgi:SAM-dependent methyltransferase
MSPRHPDGRWRAWENTALRTDSQVDAARQEIVACGLPPHGERPKNWDLLVALGTILERVGRQGAVLEMGAPRYSRLLPWLFLYGYRDLHGIDLVFERSWRAGPIRYEPMDLTATTYPGGRFDAIACLSVVEHGVEVEAYLREAARLLRPGGVLVTSTDYWCAPVETGGAVAYGVPIRVFGPADLAGWLEIAAANGLRPTGTPDYTCGDKVVTWRRFGLSYTFANLVLTRDA